ncbi:metal-dependent hydrolase [Flavobacterium cheonanense]|uniref:Metal-dependent hydrolase n=1 Tax=Flavobacterium cheonanense TaxID=706183 RepID=A0ABP7V605_9FLAO
MKLQERFKNLLITIGFNASEVNTLWFDLHDVYSTKSRYYHNLNHLKEMIVLYDEYNLELEFPNEVLFSIFYHDYVYKVTRKDNELKSAEYALSILPSITTLNKQLVFDMICATKNHQHNKIEDINWLIDFDLKILSKNWEDYKMYCSQIRKEYKIYPNILYKPGRKKALQHFLENQTIYQTQEFKTKYESIARNNIKAEINAL